TYTFHFSCGECTITLENVTLRLGFPIDDFVVIDFSTFSDLETLYDDLLRCMPDIGGDKLTTLRFSWLKVIKFNYHNKNFALSDMEICSNKFKFFVDGVLLQMLVPSHIERVGHPSHRMRQDSLAPESELPLEPKPKSDPIYDRSYSHSGGSSYHSDLGYNNYFL
ncbi:hypothetical protein J1N35_011628, partial [Gossypium stocksii]